MSRLHRQTCPIAASLNILGDNWTLLIVREAFYGVTRFKDFQANTGIAKNLLSSRLSQLVESGIIGKKDIGTHGSRHEYHLTQKGRALTPVMVALSQWGNEWVFGDGNEPVQLLDAQSGKPIMPLSPRSPDGDQLDWRDIVMRVGPGANGPMRERFAKLENDAQSRNSNSPK
ncbi:MAG: helix-turn-helix domain-containing protein [Parasphingorhabdus sp.]